jgi:F1F0 ATPase subunit 2
MTEVVRGLDPLALATAFFAGAALAGIYLAALWRSVRELAGAGRPAAILVRGALLRVVVVAGALGLAAQAGVGPFLACVAGFIVVRVAVTRRVRAPLHGDGG